METKVKNREWVKDAAIIFLAVLLVLTFFSNTIMNRTLPEVATEGVHEGAIVAKVRGTGTVTATGKHQVKAKETRTIRAVMIKIGQEVNAGDVLFVLGEGDETELEQAKERLRDLQSSYERTALSTPIFDYSSYQRAIETAQLSYNRAWDDYLAAQEKADSTATDPVTQAAKERYEAAKEYAENLERDYKEHAAQRRAELESEIAQIEAQMLPYEQAAEAQREALAAAELTLLNAQQDLDLAESEVKQAQEEYDAILRNIDSASPEVFEAYYNRLNAAIQARDLAQSYVNEAQNNVDACRAALEAALGPEYQALVNMLEARRAELASLDDEVHYEAVRAAIAERDRLYEEYEKLAGNAAQELKYAEYTLEEARITLQGAHDSLNAAQESNNRTAATTGVELQRIAEEIAVQQEKIKSLAGDESNTVLADVPGLVSTIDCTAGDTVLKNALMCTLEVPDMGYTLSFSVTNDQAQRLRIGDTATVSNYYWGNSVTATLTTIRTDPKNPQGGKVLVFDLTGDVTAGAELTISVGQKSANYDLVVPNSAIKSDTNGSYVLAVAVKSSPLGNRYTARRVSVEVLANDDNNSAVVADLTNGDYVVTTSSAPIKSGDMVRLAEND